MTPKQKITALVQEIRLNSGVGSVLRKTAHDLSYSDVILITQAELDAALEKLDFSHIADELVSILWK